MVVIIKSLPVFSWMWATIWYHFSLERPCQHKKLWEVSTSVTIVFQCSLMILLYDRGEYVIWTLLTIYSTKFEMVIIKLLSSIRPKLFALLFKNCFLQIIGVFDNLTSLLSLDLSYNELMSLASSHYSKLPPNLVELNIANNYLGKLPVRALSKLKLKLLDLRNNMLPVFSHELMKAIENGTIVLYSGT